MRYSSEGLAPVSVVLIEARTGATTIDRPVRRCRGGQGSVQPALLAAGKASSYMYGPPKPIKKQANVCVIGPECYRGTDDGMKEEDLARGAGSAQTPDGGDMNNNHASLNQ